MAPAASSASTAQYQPYVASSTTSGFGPAFSICNLANEAGTISAQSLHTALMVLLQSNFAAVSTTAQWIEALRSGSPLPKSNLVQSALDGRSAVALA